MPALLDGLNASQREVVAHSGGPLLVVGGPGSGKTRTLTERYAWLVEEGVPAECVLALTFSDPAAAAMRARLEDLLDAPYEELNVLTFHSFCVKLLQDEALEAGVAPFFSPVTPADRLALLLDRIDELSLRHHEIRGNPAPLLGSFVSRIDRLKEEMVTAEEVRAWAERLPMDTDAARAHNCREREFARLYRDHDRLLADEHEGLTVVADDERVAGELPGVEMARLDRNVRSGRRILDAAAAVNPPPRKVTGA